MCWLNLKVRWLEPRTRFRPDAGITTLFYLPPSGQGINPYAVHIAGLGQQVEMSDRPHAAVA
jgi:hypothetical protein